MPNVLKATDRLLIFLFIRFVNIVNPVKTDIINIGGKMNVSGAGGAISRTDIKRMEDHADRYYNEIRKRSSDVNAISTNTKFHIDDIKNIKNHIFFNEYDFGEDAPRRFDTNYDMAISWQRLTEGKNIQEMDLVLLRHELMEYKLMNEQKLLYREAHDITSKMYNYQKFIDDLDRTAGTK